MRSVYARTRARARVYVQRNDNPFIFIIKTLSTIIYRNVENVASETSCDRAKQGVYLRHIQCYDAIKSNDHKNILLRLRIAQNKERMLWLVPFRIHSQTHARAHVPPFVLILKITEIF